MMVLSGGGGGGGGNHDFSAVGFRGGYGKFPPK